MSSIKWDVALHVPAAWNVLPDVDDVRPKACPTCKRPSRCGLVVDLYVGLAMATRRGIDRTFWLLATADVIRGEREVDYKTLLRLGARRIHGTYSVPHRERLAATRLLYAKVLPVS